MWEIIAYGLLNHRKALLIGCGLYLVLMGYWAAQVKLTFEMSNTLPASDPAQVRFLEFRETFGSDQFALVIGLDDSSLYRLTKFLAYKDFSKALKNITGVEDVLSVVDAPRLVKDPQRTRFVLKPLFLPFPETQTALDSLLQQLRQQTFYEGQLFSQNAVLMIVTLKKEVFDTKDRYQLMDDILAQGATFSQQTGIHLHYSGLPYLRYMGSTVVQSEIHLFLMLSLLLTLGIFYVIFRSFKMVLPCALLVAIMGFSVFGTIAFLGYKITLLTALIPPIIIIISVTNCVYMVNKYHQAYTQHKDKEQALRQTVAQIGRVSFITNLTTAIGFMVLMLVKVVVLQEFGLVAGINIMMTFVLTMALLPTFLSLLPAPTAQQTRHVESPFIQALLRGLYRLIYARPRTILLIGAMLMALAVYGGLQLRVNSYMRDDISSGETVREDMLFFEKHFKGVMPLEVVIDTGQKKGFLKRSTQAKIEELEIYLSQFPSISEPLSMNRFLKAARQAYYDSPAFYGLPTARDQGLIMRYLLGLDDGNNKLYRAFVDSAEQRLRISMRVADMGSAALDKLADSLQHKVDSLFSEEDKLQAHITGTTLLFVKGNTYLIRNLFQSLCLAFVLIALTMALLFRRLRMIWMSLLINILPLLMVAGVMGLAGIDLKPSTTLIFSISFGIAVDNSIHFLAKYRLSLQEHPHTLLALRHTFFQIGSSMIYTVLILLTGFFIFTFSSFSGTQTLGMLTTLTLGLALLSNLVLLPALLLMLEPRSRQPKKKT